MNVTKAVGHTYLLNGRMIRLQVSKSSDSTVLLTSYTHTLIDGEGEGIGYDGVHCSWQSHSDRCRAGVGGRVTDSQIDNSEITGRCETPIFSPRAVRLAAFSKSCRGGGLVMSGIA